MRAALVFALLAFASADASAGCASRGRYIFKQTIPISSTRSDAPQFYVRDMRNSIVMFFKPEDIVAALQDDIAYVREKGVEVQKYDGERLRAAIAADLPLKEHTDLFKYSLRDLKFDTRLKYVLADVMKQGKVTIDNWVYGLPGSQARHDDEDPKSIVMVSEINAGELKSLWFCGPMDKKLFSVDYIFVD